MTAYLLAAFGICTVFIALVTVQGTLMGFEHDRENALHDLRAITRETHNDQSGDSNGAGSMMADLATDPRLTSLDPASCEEALGAFKSFLVTEHVHVFRADGSEACSVFGSAAKPVPPATVGWLDKVLETGAPVSLEPDIDPASGEPAVLRAVPLAGPAGDVIGALVGVTDTARSDINVPSDAPRGAVILLLDADRDLVLAASTNAPASPGDRVGDTAIGRSLSSGTSITDLDGVERLYEDVTVAPSGWHILAGVPSDVALAAARDQMRSNAIAGAVTLGVIVLLAVLLHHRLARPIRRVGRAISASLGGDAGARAPVEGPSELAHVANAFNDLIEERQVREAELWHSARHDALTGLPNRTALTEHLNAALSIAETDARARVVVLFLDLDRFKHINDAFGHAAGDRVLVALGRRLATGLPNLFVSRFGGDEYVMVTTGPFDHETAYLLAQEVAETLRLPVDVDGSDLHLTGSVGIAVSQPGDTAEDLIRNADTAMYRSKEAGTDGYAVFDQPMREWAMRRASTERDLHQAIEQGEFWLGFQPKVSLVDGAQVGFEALARWNHPTRGLVPPAEFIPIAEDSGLISVIGAWALEQACAQAVTWRQLNQGLAVPVAVNLSARQLADPKLPDLIAKTLEATGARAGDLVLEVTESAVLYDTEGVSKRLRRLRDAGIRIAIDDFGTGYSSLSYLQQLPIDELKIDRAFVSQLPFEHSSTAIIGSVIDLAHAIGLTVVAEGVETLEQLDALRQLGCDAAQGFYIARPEPAAVATRRLQTNLNTTQPPKIAASSTGATTSSWA
ncbi:MAG: putative bifunctional diguanylate cyclase/phosphodiesterase [Actinomycetota bacterium]